MKKSIHALCLAAAFVAAAWPAHAASAPEPVRDLVAIRERAGEMCGSPSTKDEELRLAACELGGAGVEIREVKGTGVETRLLLAIQRMGYCERIAGQAPFRTSWQRCSRGQRMDLRPAPVVVRGPGVLNELIAIERHYNSLCRGAVTEDDTLRDTICDLRDRLYNTLRRRGICYGKRAQTGADMRWDRCTRDSL